MNWFNDLLHDFSVVFPIALSIELSRYAVTAGVGSLITWMLWNRVFKRRKIQDRDVVAADYRREVFASLRTIFIFSMTGFGMYLGAKFGWLTIYPDFSIRGLGYFGLTLIAMFVAQDAYFYWTHRMMHHPKLFRSFHWTHHKSKTPTPWAAYAFDIPEAVVIVAFVPLWVAVVPMHDLAIFIFVSLQLVRNVMGHAGVEMSPVSGSPSRLFGWLNTTTHHDLHHQNGATNFSLYFTWWDRWMGTEHLKYQARIAEIVQRTRSDATDSRHVAATSPSPKETW